MYPFGHSIGYLRNDQTSQAAVNDPFLIQQIQFQAAATALVLLLCFVASRQSKLKESIGFLYLFSLPAKLFFYYYFFPELFSETSALSFQETRNILLPLGFFLVFEVFGLSRLLKQNTEA